VSTFEVIVGISKHTGRYGAGSAIPFQLEIPSQLEYQSTKMDLKMWLQEMRIDSSKVEMETIS
jgi:hypothetical protein